METLKVKEKVEELLKRLDESFNNSERERNLSTEIAGSREIIREFKHLVYSYDKNIPLYKEIEASNIDTIYTSAVSSYYKEDYRKIREYMEFLLYYINEYELNV